jgi:hypothetical protein
MAIPVVQGLIVTNHRSVLINYAEPPGVLHIGKDESYYHGIPSARDFWSIGYDRKDPERQSTSKLK